VTAAFQLVIDCADPDRLARFLAVALGYVLEPPPAGFASWDQYWRSRGFPEEDCGEQVPLEVRRERVDAKARRLAGLGATMVAVVSAEGTTAGREARVGDSGGGDRA
jgi:hypothetical protein